MIKVCLLQVVALVALVFAVCELQAADVYTYVNGFETDPEIEIVSGERLKQGRRAKKVPIINGKLDLRDSMGKDFFFSFDVCVPYQRFGCLVSVLLNGKNGSSFSLRIERRAISIGMVKSDDPLGDEPRTDVLNDAKRIDCTAELYYRANVKRLDWRIYSKNQIQLGRTERKLLGSGTYQVLDGFTVDTFSIYLEGTASNSTSTIWYDPFAENLYLQVFANRASHVRGSVDNLRYIAQKPRASGIKYQPLVRTGKVAMKENIVMDFDASRFVKKTRHKDPEQLQFEVPFSQGTRERSFEASFVVNDIRLMNFGLAHSDHEKIFKISYEHKKGSSPKCILVNYWAWKEKHPMTQCFAEVTLDLDKAGGKPLTFVIRYCALTRSFSLMATGSEGQLIGKGRWVQNNTAQSFDRFYFFGDASLLEQKHFDVDKEEASISIQIPERIKKGRIEYRSRKVSNLDVRIVEQFKDRIVHDVN